MSLTFKQVVERDTWEKFLLSYAPQSLFQSWLWGEVLLTSGDTVKRLGIFDGNEMVGIAQTTVVRAKRGTFLHIRHGPVWKNQNYWEEFKELIVPMVKKEGGWFVRISPLIENSEQNREMFKKLHLIPAPIHEVDAERCWVLDIDRSEDEILMGMRKTTRYEIRRAQKMMISIHTGIDHFFDLYRQTSKRQSFVPHTGIIEEIKVFKKDVVVLNASFENKTIASAIILFWGDQAIYHHGASIPSKISASYLIQWEAILEAKKRGKKLYNFWGIASDDKPNHPWRGITLFKKGFGGREINYLHAHDLPVSSLYIIPKSIETIRRIMKGY